MKCLTPDSATVCTKFAVNQGSLSHRNQAGTSPSLGAAQRLQWPARSPALAQAFHQGRTKLAFAADPVGGTPAIEVDLIIPPRLHNFRSRCKSFRVAPSELADNWMLLRPEIQKPIYSLCMNECVVYPHLRPKLRFSCEDTHELSEVLEVTSIIGAICSNGLALPQTVSAACAGAIAMQMPIAESH
eukprot:CAMPEP_0180804616 /NCGR_PEP_ID=MMETSP1038_2-20121128/61557_1 /TAXON_ID=632150 /ORGANISM="Azadinium spinosum, Strain 3D9" /LENGTH=185 /DNA_ID=CAMNT_0022845073 /DNA_START=442 /DNA_END=999 /DNA_ORIENTATION=-